MWGLNEGPAAMLLHAARFSSILTTCKTLLERGVKQDKPFDRPPSLSDKEAVILRLLVGARRKMYGLEMVEASDGALRRGTVYVTLDRMEDKGYISSRKQSKSPDGAAARRLYKVEGLGERALSAMEAAGRAFARSAT
jgi:DNA-binding MarR family transcriptional regulator